MFGGPIFSDDKIDQWIQVLLVWSLHYDVFQFIFYPMGFASIDDHCLDLLKVIKWNSPKSILVYLLILLFLLYLLSGIYNELTVINYLASLHIAHTWKAGQMLDSRPALPTICHLWVMSWYLRDAQWWSMIIFNCEIMYFQIFDVFQLNVFIILFSGQFIPLSPFRLDPVLLFSFPAQQDVPSSSCALPDSNLEYFSEDPWLLLVGNSI